MGRPPKVGTLDEVLQIRVTTRLLERIDEVRGSASRSDWARGALSTALGPSKAEIFGDDDDYIETNGKGQCIRHRRGEKRTEALGKMKASWWCATPGCTQILSG